MPPMPFPMPSLFNTAVKDICAINTFEKLPNILFGKVNISALQRYCFLQLQLICLDIKYFNTSCMVSSFVSPLGR